MNETISQCHECVHKKDVSDTLFYCRLHELEYSQNQENCVDFEYKDEEESFSVECD